jgi:rhamnose transport system ATP-binding protein
VAPVIELRGIGKRFGPVEVLADVDLSLEAGKVHSLAGENGAGKSTLVKILAGIYQPDRGQVLKDGEEISLFGATDAQRHGIAVVHQHPALFPDLSVAENIFVGRQPKRRGRVDWAAMTARARELLERLRLRIDVRLPVKMLTIAERQSVEIVRALSFDARVLVLDEPTSAISGRELERLHAIIELL